MKTISLRTLFALVIFAFCFSTLQAQSNKGKPRFGLKVGVTGSNLYDDSQAEDRNNRVGFVGGAFAKIPLGTRFDLRPELLFAMKGGQYDFTNNLNPQLELGYVEVPLSLELKLLGFINLHGGVQLSYLVNVDGVIEDAQGNGIKFDFDEDDFERLDYGWHLGGGFDFGNIGLHLRVSRGLQEIGKTTNVSAIVGDLKNSAWALTLSAAL